VVVRRLAVRRFGSRSLSTADMTKGLVLGIYSKEKEDDVPQFTSAGENFDKLLAGKLRETLNISGPPLKAGKTRTFYGLHQRGAGRFKTWSSRLWRWIPVETLRLLRRERCSVSMNTMT
ncbi:LAP3 isoform 8, partial [Pan troglodytes]